MLKLQSCYANVNTTKHKFSSNLYCSEKIQILYSVFKVIRRIKGVFCTDKVVVALLGRSMSADCLCEALYLKGNECVVENRLKASPLKNETTKRNAVSDN